MPDSQVDRLLGGRQDPPRRRSTAAPPTEIPFQVSDSRDVVDPPRPMVDVVADSFTTRMPRFASVSPDGRQVVFETLGKLYIKHGRRAARRARSPPQDGDFQLFPSWSRDGSRIAFV